MSDIDTSREAVERLIASDGAVHFRDTIRALLTKAEAAERERDALRAQMAWQPIETAPMDGTVFRAGYFIDDKFYQFDCFYGKKHHVCASQYCDSDWHNKKYGYQKDAFRCAVFEEQMKPTHWRPLPTPPEAP